MTAPLVLELGGGRFCVPCAGTCGGADGHVVSIASDVVRCDCPAGVFARPCKHVAQVTAHLLIAPLPPPGGGGPGLQHDVPLPEPPESS